MAVTRRGFFGAVAAAIGVVSGVVKLNRQPTLREIYVQGRMSKRGGFYWYMDQDLTTQRELLQLRNERTSRAGSAGAESAVGRVRR